jgi:Terpene synthase family, metal binding domain.
LKERLQVELKYPFGAEIHPLHKSIIGQTITWATVFHNLLRGSEELKVFQTQKLGLLSCYLYPETELDTAVWIAKLYTWLFYLDDMTDHIPKGQKSQFWNWVTQGMDRENLLLELHTLPGRVWELIRIWYELQKELESLENMSASKIALVDQEVGAFIQYNFKEARMKDADEIPEPSEFIRDKPFFSGASLAVNFTCLDMDESFESESEEWNKSQEIRELGAKLIFLSNDLISFRKERKKGDAMNYLSILMRKNSWTYRKAESAVLKEFQQTLDEFLQLDRKIRSDFDPGNLSLLHCLKQIKYKVAGSNHWSFHVTTRHE